MSNKRRPRGWIWVLGPLLQLFFMDVPESGLPGQGVSRRRKKIRKMQKEIERHQIESIPTEPKKKRKRKWIIYGVEDRDDD